MSKTKDPQKEKLAEWEARKTAFLKEARALSEKYRIDLTPRLTTTQLSSVESVVSSSIELVDVSEHYEHTATSKES